MKKFCLIAFITLYIGLSAIYAQTINTYAGNGYVDYSGDGSQATAAQLYNPMGMAFDKAGNTYVADQGNNVIRKISNTGIVSTFAGNGTAGFSGDKGPATKAELNQPYGVAADPAGNVYISDRGNNRIRMVNTSGIITTFAGTGVASFMGNGTPATTAELNQPAGITCDAGGNLYIADEANERIREVSAGIIITLAGKGVIGDSGDGKPAINAQLRNPVSVAVDGNGNLYFADQGNNRVQIVNNAGIINTVAGNMTAGFAGDGGPATAAEINKPEGVCVDVYGNLYIADKANSRIRMVNKSGVISTFAGMSTSGYSGDGGPAIVAELNTPVGLITDDTGNVYLADSKNFVIRKVDTAGTISTVVGDGTGGYSGNMGAALLASTGLPDGVASDAAGNIYFADQLTSVIRKISPDSVITTVAGIGVPGYSGDAGPAINAGLNRAAGVAVDAAGNVYIADCNNNRIRKYDTTTGIINTVAGTGIAGFSGDGGPAGAAMLKSPYAIAVDAAGNIYFSDLGNYRIRKINTSGIITTVAGDGVQGYNGNNKPALATELSLPLGIAVDSKGNLYIADNGQEMVRKVGTNDTITTVAGDGYIGSSGDGGPATAAEMNGPTGVSVDNIGNIYVSDASNNTVRFINTAGNIYTLAGDGKAGFSGDGGVSYLAKLNKPTGICVDNNNNLVIADHNNNRIRRLSGTIVAGLNEVQSVSNSVSVYPNPSKGVYAFEVKSEELKVKSIIEVYNVLGQQVYSNSLVIPDSSFQIDLTAQPNGVYLYRVISETGTVMGEGKLIKE
jgi:sugar lactone lactonase YvrE